MAAMQNATRAESHPCTSNQDPLEVMFQALDYQAMTAHV